MADVAKHLSKGGGLVTDIHSLVSPLRARRSNILAYGFLFAFVACTAFLAFNPSATSSPWFDRFFTSTSSTASAYRSRFSSWFSRIFPESPPSAVYLPPSVPLTGIVTANRSGSVPPEKAVPEGKNLTAPPAKGVVGDPRVSNFTASLARQNTTATAHRNGTVSPVTSGETKKTPGIQSNVTSPVTQSLVNGSKSIPGDLIKKIPVSGKNDAEAISAISANGTEAAFGNLPKGVPTNLVNSTKLDPEQPSEKTNKTSTVQPAASPTARNKISLDALRKCDMFDGKWVKDDSYPLYKEGSCPYIDEPFDCFNNGRPDLTYEKLRWQPKSCNVPRLNASDMLERLRGRRLVFVGDSLNRNMWESLVCGLRNSVKDKNKVFEASGRREFRTEGSYSFVFGDYNASVEFFRSPFLVQEWEMPESNGSKKETLRLDLIEKKSDKYKQADVIIFNTGHWWTHEKTSLGKNYYQEGSHVYGQLNVVDAYHKALLTWARWVDKNINPSKTVVFFRGYSAVHFSGGRWNSGGSCDKETEPIYNESYLSKHPQKMRVLEMVLSEMKTPISYLNITRMTDYRKDAHPSIYRKKGLTDEERRSPDRYQDCSHWCLPGVPDVWNELLYAQLLVKLQ